MELLAANAPMKKPAGGWIDWSEGEQAGDLTERQSLELIHARIRERGVGEGSLLWHEEYNSDEVTTRRTWASRQVTRHWAKAFTTGGGTR